MSRGHRRRRESAQCRPRQRQAGVLIILYRQPAQNIISTVDLVRAMMPQLRASISPAIDIDLGVDRSTTIRTSLRDVERTLILSVMLVIIVVFAFLRNLRATSFPSSRLGLAGRDLRRHVPDRLQPR